MDCRNGSMTNPKTKQFNSRKISMKRVLKYAVLAVLAVAAAISAKAETNLLQAVTVDLLYFSQGPTNVNDGVTNYTVNGPIRLDTKYLINALSTNGYKSGDVLVRATPVTNVTVYVTNLVPTSTNTLLITNESTSEETVSNYLIFNSGSPVLIGNTNLSFTTNASGSNSLTVAVYGVDMLTVGTNATESSVELTNQVGNVVGTSYTFVNNTLNPVATGVNSLGTATWDIYNSVHHLLSPISTNVYFDIHTDDTYGLTNVPARVHGEQVTHQNVIKFRTTDEIRTLVLSNTTVNLKLVGYAHGHLASVALGGGAVGTVQDYSWVGSGSGTITNYPDVLTGGITEQYYKFLKQ